MVMFVDTSALYALLSANDQDHLAAIQAWGTLEDRGNTLVTSNYVLLETLALVGRRLGLQAVRDCQTQLMPAIELEWVDKTLHERAMAILLAAGRRDLSLVDCVSFEIMRRQGLTEAFTFDAHFAEQGFRCIP